MYITEMKTGTEYNWNGSGEGCFLQRLHSSSSGNRACRWTRGLFGFRCFQMCLVMYTQDLERTWDDVAQVFVADADGKRVRSGWVLFVNSRGEQVVVLFCQWEPLQLMESRQKVQSHNVKGVPDRDAPVLASIKLRRCVAVGGHRILFFFWRRVI